MKTFKISKALLGLLTLAFIFSCCVPQKVEFDCDKVTNLQITSPMSSVCLDIDSLDDAKVIVTGTATNVQNQEIVGHLYVFVYPTIPYGGGWYIQAEAEFENDSTWFCVIQIGDRAFETIPEDGDKFRLAAYVTPYKEEIDSLLSQNPPRIENFSDLKSCTKSPFNDYVISVRDTCM